MPRESAYADLTSVPRLSEREQDVYSIVLERWPTTALEIAEHFNENLADRDSKKKASTKYAYYLRKLVERRLLLSKRAGNTLIVWPLHTEKYRTIHNMLKEG
ncbi:hypothetical protein KKH30_01120 [Candidatus Micrarchaeota archaeon]|nr:hypothetical protein [Candidatus Micrarchaeota archaeon]MBU1939343.1 hypothetical protein [Candidatus Micrarchaeota archaeon]